MTDLIQQNRIIRDFFSLIEFEDILQDRDSCELFWIWYDNCHLGKLLNDNKIAKKDKQAATVSLGLMYINMCMLYAKFHLTPEQYDNFFVFLCFDYCCAKEDGYAHPNVVYSKLGKEDYILAGFVKIEKEDCLIYPHIKDVIGLSDFDYYYRRYGEEEDEFEYYLVPKSLTHIVEERVHKNPNFQ